MYSHMIRIQGGRPLHGSVTVSGAKNAALPELASVLLSDQPFKIRNVPEVEDIRVMLNALNGLGAETDFHDGNVEICLSGIRSCCVPPEIVRTSRASILLLGPLLARAGEARVSLPGGCPIGDRKFNFHLEGLRRMGARIHVEDDFIVGRAPRLRGIDYTFPGVSVTGTENLLMAACLAEGETILRGCAQEPEIGDLIQLLQGGGADIQLQGKDVIRVRGHARLSGISHRVIPDRIEMGTYLIAGGFTGNDVTVEGGDPEALISLIQLLLEAGIDVEMTSYGVRVRGTGDIRPVDIETLPFPGFPTDLQAQMTTLMTQADGISRIKENIFDNRFQHTVELGRMGANISVSEDTAHIAGPTALTGCPIHATDLRASAALVLGGLIASGETVVRNADQLFRGYEKLPEKLNNLGAEIRVERE